MAMFFKVPKNIRWLSDAHSSYLKFQEFVIKMQIHHTQHVNVSLESWVDCLFWMMPILGQMYTIHVDIKCIHVGGYILFAHLHLLCISFLQMKCKQAFAIKPNNIMLKFRIDALLLNRHLSFIQTNKRFVLLRKFPDAREYSLTLSCLERRCNICHTFRRHENKKSFGWSAKNKIQ